MGFPRQEYWSGLPSPGIEPQSPALQVDSLTPEPPAKHNIQITLQKITCFYFIDYAKAFNYMDHNKLWKILKEMGIPDHLTCLLRNL